MCGGVKEEVLWGGVMMLGLKAEVLSVGGTTRWGGRGEGGLEVVGLESGMVR